MKEQGESKGDSLEIQVQKRTEELVSTNKALEVEIAERKRAEGALRESEERLKAIFNSVRAGILIIDPETHVIVDANPVAIEMIGALKSQIVGSICHKFVCPAEEGRCPVTDLGQMVFNAEKLLLRIDGKAVPIIKIVNKVSLCGRDRLIESFIDISERKRVENALQESEGRYRAFFDNSIDAVLITSPDGSIQEANAEACRTFGMTREELVRAGRSGVTDPSDPRLAVAVEERAQTGRFKGELNLRRSDGTLFPCEVSSSVFTDKKGLVKTSMIIRDITERKRMLKEREDLIVELQQALAEVKTLRGILPICASCKKIRDDKGYWNQIESYIRDHSEAQFSHSLCPECVKKLYPELSDKLIKKDEAS